MVNVCFAFLTQNSAKYLYRNLQWLHGVAQTYDDYRIVFVENDSVDNTVDILNEFMLRDTRISGSMALEQIGTSTSLCSNKLGAAVGIPIHHNCKERLQRLATLRQRLLQQALQWQASEFVVMLDIDFVYVDAEHLRKVISYVQSSSVDGVFAKSILTTGHMYDSFAIKNLSGLIQVALGIRPYVRVESGFGGVAVYKTQSIRSADAHYSSKTSDCEHVFFNTHFSNLEIATKFNPVYSNDSCPSTPNGIEVLYCAIVPLVLLYLCCRIL